MNISVLRAFIERICFLLLNTKRYISGRLLHAVYVEKSKCQKGFNLKWDDSCGKFLNTV